MVKLFCALVGAAGSAFSVRVDESDSVDGLKKAIKAANEDITCAARKLDLCLAKKGDAWLNSDGADAVTLDDGGNPQGFDEDGHAQAFNKMDPSLWIKNDRYFGQNFQPNEGGIHVLVVMPADEVRTMEVRSNEERGAKRQKVEEAPDIWMAALHDERVDILPLDREGLQAHLERELRVKIPVSEDYIKEIIFSDKQGRCTAKFKKLFADRIHGMSPRTGRILWNAINPGTSGSEGATKGTYHVFWDSLIANVLREVGRGNFRRNSNASTSIGLGRPDLCYYYAKQNVCVFRGKEKPGGEMQVPLKGLCEKLIWRYDDAPYVFGYAAVGFQVCLVVIRKDSVKPRGAKAEVINLYDLSELDGRLSFLLALLNLSTLFRPVVELIQPFSVPDYGILRRTNGVTIFFAEDCVIKEYPSNMPSNAIIYNLKTLHGQMKEHSVPNVVTLVKANLKKRRALLAPVGLVARPTDVKQLVTALRDILTALVALHKLKLMHRDLRWDNVLKYQQDHDEWFLIDFDESASSPATNGALHLDPTSHAPEIASAHSVKVDIWGVGYLLLTTTVLQLPYQLDAIREQCLQENPAKRPIASSLLEAVQKSLVTLA